MVVYPHLKHYVLSYFIVNLSLSQHHLYLTVNYLYNLNNFVKILASQKFSLKEKQDFTYNACHMGVTCKISVLTKNDITLCNRWSTIEETSRFLDSFEADKKKDVLMNKLIQWVVRIQFMNRDTLLRWLCEDLNILQNQEAVKNYWKTTMIDKYININKINIKSFKCQGQFSWEKCVLKLKWWTKRLYFVDRWGLCKANAFVPWWAFIW